MSVSPLDSSTPVSSRSSSPASPINHKARLQSALPVLPLPPTSDPFSNQLSLSSSSTPTPSWRRTHSRSKSSSSVSPPPAMIRANSLPLPFRPSRTSGSPSPPPPTSPKWMTTTASPAYRNSFIPTFPSPSTSLANISALAAATGAKRPIFLRTATPPPPQTRTPPTYLATEVFPGTIPTTDRFSSYPPSLTSGASSPTSSRSCSPSLTTYSLETIEDSPDGELLAAVLEEEEEKERQQQQQKSEDKDAATIGLGLSLMTSGMSNMSINPRKRQRWSVCGAERRSDFDLETIYED